MAQCPCDSGSDLDECCGPIILGHNSAPTAAALMRSRYTAFVRGDLDHIVNSCSREERDSVDRAAVKSTFDTVQWLGLDILDTIQGHEGDETGTVEFAARFKKDGQQLVHRERSNFRREEGRWVYVDGDVNPKGDPRRVVKVGRNQPCPCGSGKKFKKCCGA